jgi:hypothetical protein
VLIILKSWKQQTLEIWRSDIANRVTIKESNSFRGIPYADYFNVNTEWNIVSVPSRAASSMSDSNVSGLASPTTRGRMTNSCRITIHLDFVFHKSTWLQSTIESNTKAELIGIYELWLECAQDSLRRALDRRAPSTANLAAAVATGVGASAASANNLLLPPLGSNGGDAGGTIIDATTGVGKGGQQEGVSVSDAMEAGRLSIPLVHANGGTGPLALEAEAAAEEEEDDEEENADEYDSGHESDDLLGGKNCLMIFKFVSVLF